MQRTDKYGNYAYTQDGVEYEFLRDSEVKGVMEDADVSYVERERKPTPPPAEPPSEPEQPSTPGPDYDVDIGPPFKEGDAIKVDNAQPFDSSGMPRMIVEPITDEGIVTEVFDQPPSFHFVRIDDMYSKPWGVKTPIYVKFDTSNGKYSTAGLNGGWVKYDTGGYTGSWGSEGRIAMLHQKELVLNAADTENMLKAVEIVRKIVRVIDLNAANAANAFGALTATTAATNEQIIEQQVTIHAEFPNATNHSEIEEAFNNLINHATQFANRKK